MSAPAIQLQRTGGPEALELVDRDPGAPGPGEVRIRQRACGVNFLDVYHRTGLYPLPLPTGIGVEGAGVVEAVGPGVGHLAPGDRVAYAAPRPGGYAAVRVVAALTVVRLPAAIDFEHGAAMMLKGLTVQYLLRRTHPQTPLAPGDALVWHAAAGGVGILACQWARALGLRLIATAGTDEKCALAIQHGAAHAINYRRDDVARAVRDLTGGAGVRVVYDSVGKDTWEASLDCLAPLGLMVSFGNASGPVPPVSLAQLAQKGSLHVTRPTLFTHLATPAAVAEMTGELFDHVTAGRVAIPEPRTYPLAAAADAHRDLERRATTGASVLVP
jgi:NADPH2:quinone reductase